MGNDSFATSGDNGRRAVQRTPTGRRLRVLVVIVTLALVFALGGVVASRFMVSPAQRDAMAEAPPPSLITAAVTERELEDTVVTRGDVVALSSVDALAGRAFPISPAVITKAPLAVGKQAAAGSVLVEVAGRPVIALPGDLPAYQDLATGSSGPLVAQLQKALTSMGIKVTDAEGTFGGSTAAGVRAVYATAGYPEQDTLPMAEVSFLPALPAQVVTSSARRGSLATEASLVIAAGNPVVRIASPDQQLLALARQGAKARLADELGGEAADGVLQAPEQQLTGDGGSQNPEDQEPKADEAQPAGGAAETTVTVLPDEPLPMTWFGANVRVTVSAAATEGKVLTVPSGAIRVDGEGRTVVTLVGDDGQRDVEVVTGLTGGGFVQVDGDLAAGDQARVGERR